MYVLAIYKKLVGKVLYEFGNYLWDKYCERKYSVLPCINIKLGWKNTYMHEIKIDVFDNFSNIVKE